MGTRLRGTFFFEYPHHLLLRRERPPCHWPSVAVVAAALPIMVAAVGIQTAAVGQSVLNKWPGEQCQDTGQKRQPDQTRLSGDSVARGFYFPQSPPPLRGRVP